MKPPYKELREAVCDNDPAAVEEMIQRGADITETDNVGNSLLMWAAQGREDTARTLIAHDADVNHKNGAGYTALMWASTWKHTSIARLLIESGADINAQRDGGESVLMMAATAGAADIVKLLLEKGVDVNARNNLGRTVMDALDNDGRISAIAMKDLIKNHRVRIETAAQKAESDDVSARVRHLKQRAPKVRLKGLGL